jgi:catechol 2,3-dioxygenase
MTQDLITYGPVHLEVTDTERSARFWQEIVGLERRGYEDDGVALGTQDEALVVLHGGARAPFRKGHSGLYHLAVHAPTAIDFARILARLIRKNYPIGPTDHTGSKAIYLADPDGIEVEITLETPEQMESVRVEGRNMRIIATDGTVRGMSAPLDVNPFLRLLPAGEHEGPVAPATRIGHVHLYTADLTAAYTFYQQLGFEPSNFWSQLRFADLSAGGVFKHRLAVNTWQGEGAPQSPPGTARMRHFTLRFASQALLDTALHNVSAAKPHADGYLVYDPSGNQVILTVA